MTPEEEELAKYAPKGDARDSSPIEGEVEDDWDDIDNEFAEFCDAEDIEVESETESESGNRSDSSTSSTPNGQQRKREEEAAAGDAPTSDPEEGSRLQKRKKEALSRTTSLTNMAIPSTGDGKISAVDAPDAENLDGIDEEDDDDDDDADLEAALAAEMEKDDDDGGEAQG